MVPDQNEKDTWRDERGFVLSKVSQIESSLGKVDSSVVELGKELREFRLDQRAENVKASFRQSIIGALTIAVPALLAFIWWLITNWPHR